MSLAAISENTVVSPIVPAARDLVKAAAVMGRDEVRYLVDLYYMVQENRKRAGNQERALTEGAEPATLLDWCFGSFEKVEATVKRALGFYAQGQPAGAWALSQHGIGPVLAAGLLAHIDIERAPTAGHIWSFAGLTDSAAWLGGAKATAAVKLFADSSKSFSIDQMLELSAKIHCDPKWLARVVCRAAGGLTPFRDMQRVDNRRYMEIVLADAPIPITIEHVVSALSKRPWNAALKVLCWKIGDSFVKQSGSEKCFYGHYYRQRKAIEVLRNEQGDFSDTAARTLEIKKIQDKDTRAKYEAGLLPDGRIDLRARRWAVKLLLAHFHEVLHFTHFGHLPVRPYVLVHTPHVHYIAPPNHEMIPGMADAIRAERPRA